MTTSTKDASQASAHSTKPSFDEIDQAAKPDDIAVSAGLQTQLPRSRRHLWGGALLIGLAVIAMVTVNLGRADSVAEPATVSERSSANAARDRDVLGSATTDSATTDSAGAITVNVVRVGSLTAPSLSHSYPGMLIARRESELGFERAGRIVRLSVEEGDQVEVGDVLGELDQEDLDASEQRIQSELAVEQALLEELIAGPRKETIQAAQARVDELKARVDLAQVDADRQVRLASENATSRSQLDTAVFGLKATERSLIAAQSVLNELLEGSRAEKITAQKAKCRSTEARLGEIRAQRNDSTIVAPFSGKVQSRLLDEGGVVNAGESVLHLISHAFEVQVGLPSEVALQISRQGEAIVVKGDDQITGKVDRLAPSVNRRTRTRDVFLSLRDDDPDLNDQDLTVEGWVPGEIVHVKIEVTVHSENGKKFWLPISSIVRGTRGLWTALVIPGELGEGVCERRSVEVLKTDGTFALVQGMIQEGDRVIADGMHKVTAGLLVVEAE